MMQGNGDFEGPAILGGAAIRSEGPPVWPLRSDLIREAVLQTWESGDWGRYHGASHDKLIGLMSEILGTEHNILCASGTAAVELALRGLKVGAGDEVILSAYDFKGNFQDVLAVGAVPVLVDVDPETCQLNVQALADAVSPRTRAIIATHLHGGIVPMAQVMEFAQQRGIGVLEDACQMPGARVAGRRAGTWGDVGTWSFGGSKLLTAGRGGAVFTNDAEIAQRIRLWTQRGNEAYPLSELQASVLIPQLGQLESQEIRRLNNVLRLCELLQNEKGLVPFSVREANSRPGFYKLGLRYRSDLFGLKRDRFAAAMRAEGIAIDCGFRALHKIHSARRFRAAGKLAIAAELDDDILVLHHPILLTDREADLVQIVQAVEKVRSHAEAIGRLGPS